MMMKCFCLVLVSSLFAGPALGSDSDGLVAHFTFDGVVADVSGNNWVVTANDLTLAADRSGKPLSACAFNGSSSYFTVPGIPVPLDNSFSWSVWLKPAALNNDTSVYEGRMTPLIQRGVALGNNYMSPGLWLNPNASVTFYSHDGSNQTSFDSASDATPVGTWSHLAVTSDRAGRRTIYVNGIAIASLPASTYGFHAGLLFVGRDRRFPVYFSGLMDDIRIYNRPLSESEIFALANPPTIVGVIPASGPTEGGTRVVISGTNFSSDPLVLFGGVPALEIDRISDTRITALTPPNQPGMAEVSVNGATENAFYYRPICGSDLDQNGAVDGGDMAILLLDWGPCYQAPLAAPAPEVPPLLDAQALPDAPRQR